MAKIKPSTRVVYDYHELVHAVNERTGRDIRDWSGHFKPQYNPSVIYQDFWHYALESIFYDVSNGCTQSFFPLDALENVADIDDEGNSQEWIREILGHFIDLFKENDMPDEVTVEIAW